MRGAQGICTSVRWALAQITAGGTTGAQSDRYYKLSGANPCVRGAVRINWEGEDRAGRAGWTGSHSLLPAPGQPESLAHLRLAAWRPGLVPRRQ